MSHQELSDLWFALVTFLWCGYFFLEGFDFGVGILLPVLGRDPDARRAMVGSIGPFWDGNEVWVIVAIGATFAAFPAWYATLLSATYPLMLLVLVALIFRAVAFEFRGKGGSQWERWWTRALTFGSAVPPLVWGLVLTGQLAGFPIDRNGNFVGSFWDLFGWLPILGALGLFALCAAHGATYLCLRTTDPLRSRARRVVILAWCPAAILLAALFAGLLLTSSVARSNGAIAYVLPVLTLLALVATLLLSTARRERLAFLATGVAVLGVVITLFVELYPDAVVSSLHPAFTLTAAASASGEYTLTAMSIAAVVFAPAVVLYQAWTYWVFRKRLSSRPVEVGRPAEQHS